MLRISVLILLALALTVSGCQSSRSTQTEGQPQSSQTVNDMGNLAQNQALWTAVAEGDQEAVLKLLDDGADPNTVDSKGRTSAMIAVHSNQLDVFNLLAQHGADINNRDQRSDNPLLYAGAEGLLPFVRAAIAAGADTTLTNRFGGTALIPAADRGHVEIVEELLTISDVNIDHVNNLGWTALLEAVILGDGGERHQRIVDLLIEHGADVNLGDSAGVTPLQHAKKHGYQEMIKSLEQAGAR
ncbi:ankyrin repeat domain-containing protein [Paenibacillus sp. 1011MAR3C5]|uniref:ankyrin repeat domain-containing protein n=1 Tax=Paenibacillus sp. 1011MAR3C5 TaxID=1675787 RepID=UPI000E6C3E4A|nr:ankyrin repeat domain-containing protein [Paenibacillus sp. 1011MAR3C5]RJE83925.1 ankyrin repeat domain-containing protein [Paenibacillus sp. 1011MAR3C5]